MGRLSRNKGKTGERELAHELQRVLGVTARRGVQYAGGTDSPDVVTDIDSIHIECKRTEHFRLFEALEQSIRDAGESKVPVVMHRPNHRPWVVVLRLDDLPALVETIHQFKASGIGLQASGNKNNPEGSPKPKTKEVFNGEQN